MSVERKTISRRNFLIGLAGLASGVALNGCGLAKKESRVVAQEPQKSVSEATSSPLEIPEIPLVECLISGETTLEDVIKSETVTRMEVITHTKEEIEKTGFRETVKWTFKDATLLDTETVFNSVEDLIEAFGANAYNVSYRFEEPHVWVGCKGSYRAPNGKYHLFHYSKNPVLKEK